MNTITFDGGVKRQFVLPAAIVLSAHAAIFFGFVSNPAMPRLDPPRIREKEYKQVDFAQPEKAVVEKGNDQSQNSLQQQQRPEIPNPISPEQREMQGISITPVLSATFPIFVGPLSPGGPGPGAGPVVPTYDPNFLDHTPEAVRQPQPIYPLDAKNKSESGDVVVIFVVDESGCVLNAHAVSSSDPVFEEPTLRAIEQWRFRPGTVHGRPVRFRMSVPVAFHVDS